MVLKITTEKEILPASGMGAQLFILFGDDTKLAQQDSLIAQIKSVFEHAIVVIATPLSVQEQDGQALSWLANQDIKNVVDVASTYIVSLQEKYGVAAQATALLGVSDGASLVLELTRLDPVLAGRAIVFGGTYIQTPEQLSLEQTVHLLFAANDLVLTPEHIKATHALLSSIESDATVDVAHNTDDHLCADLIAQAINRLQTCVPLRYWKQAQEASIADEQETKH